MWPQVPLPLHTSGVWACPLHSNIGRQWDCAMPMTQFCLGRWYSLPLFVGDYVEECWSGKRILGEGNLLEMMTVERKKLKNEKADNLSEGRLHLFGCSWMHVGYPSVDQLPTNVMSVNFRVFKSSREGGRDPRRYAAQCFPSRRNFLKNIPTNSYLDATGTFCETHTSLPHEAARTTLPGRKVFSVCSRSSLSLTGIPPATTSPSMTAAFPGMTFQPWERGFLRLSTSPSPG